MPLQIEEEITLLCKLVVWCGQLDGSCSSARTLALIQFGTGVEATATKIITAKPPELGNHQPHQ